MRRASVNANVDHGLVASEKVVLMEEDPEERMGRLSISMPDQDL
jgi:hypothetical protein